MVVDMIVKILNTIDVAISITGNVLDKALTKGWRKVYSYEEWKCKRFGHKPYYETRTFRSHWACKRGCGPL